MTNNIKGTLIRLSADLSTKTLQARREWHDIFKVMKGKNLQPRILYPAKLSFRFDGEIKSFPDKHKLREFSTTKSALEQMLKDLLQAESTRKRPTESKPKIIKKTVIGSYILIITLNVNGLNAPTKRHRLSGWMKTCAYMHFHLHHSARHPPNCM